MDRVYQANVSTVATALPSPGSLGYPQGDAALPEFTPTTPGPHFYDWLTESIMNVVEAASLTPDAQDLTQLYQAIKLLAIVPSDPLFAFVGLLLHFNGAAGSTSIVDSSSHNVTPVVHGTPALESTVSKFGNAACGFSSLYSYIDIAAPSVNLAVGLDYCVEAWCYPTAYGDAGSLWSTYLDSSYGRGFGWIMATGRFRFGEQGAGSSLGDYTSIDSDVIVPLNAWTHIACVKQGPTMNIYINGILSGSSYSGVRSGWPNRLVIGQDQGTAWAQWVGYIDEFRVTVGNARYTENFTPSTQQFPDQGPV